jgi:hypothetical protein
VVNLGGVEHTRKMCATAEVTVPTVMRRQRTCGTNLPKPPVGSLPKDGRQEFEVEPYPVGEVHDVLDVIMILRYRSWVL